MALLLAFVLLLELICRLGLVGGFFLIPPSEMAIGLAQMLRSGVYNFDIANTLLAITIAGSAAIVAGFMLGAVMHRLPRLRHVIDPLLATYYAIPIFVFYPLLIVLFGIGDMAKIAIGFMYAVAIMITNTMTGLDRVPKVLIKTARVNRMGAGATTLLVILPSAMPSIFTGIKFAVAYAFVGVLGAEFILSTHGIGYRIAFSLNNFDNEKMYGLILLVLILASTMNMGLFARERIIRQRRGL